MKKLTGLITQAFRQVAGAAGTVVLWIVWVLLGAALTAQIIIATRHELTVPDFVLRRLEARLAATGLRTTFERAVFDPTGRIFVQRPRVFLPQFEDPVVTARAAYVGLNPWALVTGRLELGELRLLEGTVFVPAMLSPSGQPDAIVRDVDALLIPGQRQLAIRHVNGRVGGLVVTVHGAVAYRRGPVKPPADVAATLRQNFAAFCRLAATATARLQALDEPALDLELEPLASPGGIDISADLFARGFRLDAPVAARLGRFRARAHVPLLGNAPTASTIEVQAERLELPRGIEVRQVSAWVQGRFHPDERRLEPVLVEVTAGKVQTPDGVAEAVSAIARPSAPTKWDADAVGRALGSVLGIAGTVDIQERSASMRLAGSVSPEVLETINHHVRVDVRKFFDFQSLECPAATVEIGPAWKFQRARAHVVLRGISAHGVPMDEGEATVEVDPHRLYAPEAYARIGPNWARGTYEQVLATREFRFLLEGRLRPLDIAGWFRPWWTNFFERFGFPVEPPLASVDVHGVWREGRQTTVFVFADAKAPVITGQKLARVRTRLFIRPGFYDGLELLAMDVAGGAASGTFTVATNVESGKWRSVDVDAHAAVPLATANRVGGEFVQRFLAPFESANAPDVTFKGHFDGPDLGDVRHERLDLTARSAGLFKFNHLPLSDVAFTATLRDDDLVVDSNQAKFAGGAVRLHATVSGTGPARRVAFDAAIADASLGAAVSALQDFNAGRKGQPPPPPGKFVQEKANVRLDVNAVGEGKYSDAFSFHGNGKADLRGAEIGEVPLFGPLSELLKFTALRFTTAHATFRINGPKLEFPEVSVRGANSAIDAHGDYAFDRRQLDFRAKVFPFQESGNVIKAVVGAVLTPISSALEVKLTGTLEKPDWAFVIGPTNLLRSLAPTEPAPAPEGAAPEAAKAGTAGSAPPDARAPASAAPPSPEKAGAAQAAPAAPKTD